MIVHILTYVDIYINLCIHIYAHTYTLTTTNEKKETSILKENKQGFMGLEGEKERGK